MSVPEIGTNYLFLVVYRPMHRGLGRWFCERYEVAHATIQMLTNLVLNESLEPQGYRFDYILLFF